VRHEVARKSEVKPPSEHPTLVPTQRSVIGNYGVSQLEGMPLNRLVTKYERARERLVRLTQVNP
jgi:hypothetical protein